MRILAISDRPARTSIKQIVASQPIDLIVTLGDFDLSQLRELQDITDIPKLGVYGNHCSGMYMESLGIINMHLQRCEYMGLIFGGFEGSVRYKQTPDAKMYTQEEAQALLKDFPHVDVMLVHCPPFGVNDEPDELAHQGFKALNEYIEREKPRYLMHGHTYEEDLNTDKVGDTNIIYVTADKIVEIS